MERMFYNSKFNRDISRWDVSKVKRMNSMFAYSEFNQDISRWKVSKVINFYKMFFKSNFNRDISKWKIRKDCDTSDMLTYCTIKDEYKPKLPK